MFEDLVVGMTTQPVVAVNGDAPTSTVRAANTESFEGSDRLDAWGAFNREYLDRGAWATAFRWSRLPLGLSRQFPCTCET